jgi:hypothetical protein
MRKYDVILHGIYDSQDFPGQGTLGTPYKNVVTGIGYSAKEAYEDAIEMYYTCATEPYIRFPKRIPIRGSGRFCQDYTADDALSDCSVYCYVSILW